MKQRRSPTAFYLTNTTNLEMNIPGSGPRGLFLVTQIDGTEKVLF